MEGGERGGEGGREREGGRKGLREGGRETGRERGREGGRKGEFDTAREHCYVSISLSRNQTPPLAGASALTSPTPPSNTHTAGTCVHADTRRISTRARTYIPRTRRLAPFVPPTARLNPPAHAPPPAPATVILECRLLTHARKSEFARRVRTPSPHPHTAAPGVPPTFLRV